MKTKSVAGLIAAALMVVVVGSVQAKECFRDQPGWHMVSKSCDIRAADNWQEYTSGVYTQPLQENKGI